MLDFTLFPSFLFVNRQYTYTQQINFNNATNSYVLKSKTETNGYKVTVYVSLIV